MCSFLPIGLSIYHPPILWKSNRQDDSANICWMKPGKRSRIKIHDSARLLFCRRSFPLPTYKSTLPYLKPRHHGSQTCKKTNSTLTWVISPFGHSFPSRISFTPISTYFLSYVISPRSKECLRNREKFHELREEKQNTSRSTNFFALPTSDFKLR